MDRLFRIYLLPAALINAGNAFAYLFQLLITRNLSVVDVGTFNSVFALTNVISAPAAVLPFAIARMLISAHGSDAAVDKIVSRSALGGIAVAVLIVTGGSLLMFPLSILFKGWQPSTVLPALILISTNVLYGIAVGWLQGEKMYIASSLALASIPALRCLFGVGLLVYGPGGVDWAIYSAGLPGAVLFCGCALWFFGPINAAIRPLPRGVFRDFVRFLFSASVSSVLLLGFCNLDVVLAKLKLAPEASGLYAVAAVLARIPFLMSTALVGVLFSEATRATLYQSHSPRAVQGVLAMNCALAGVIGIAVAAPLAYFAENALYLFGGSEYVAAAPILGFLGFAMVLLAQLQIVTTFLFARNQYRVLWLLAGGLATFLIASYELAEEPVTIVKLLSATIATLLVACLVLSLSSPAVGYAPQVDGLDRADRQ